jgi:hypothetical protein
VTPIGLKQFMKTQIKVVVDVVSDLDSGEKALTVKRKSVWFKRNYEIHNEWILREIEDSSKLKKETEIGETYMKLRRNWVFQRWELARNENSGWEENCRKVHYASSTFSNFTTKLGRVPTKIRVPEWIRVLNVSWI